MSIVVSGKVEVADAVRPGLKGAWRDQVVRWGLSEEERRALLPDGEIEVDGRVPADTAERISILIEIGHRLRFESGRALRDWLREPVLMFALDAPLDVMGGPVADLLRMRTLVERGFGS